MIINNAGTAKKGSSLAERSKYQFEADSEDEYGCFFAIRVQLLTCLRQMEDEIDQNLDLLHGAAGRLSKTGSSLMFGGAANQDNREPRLSNGRRSRCAEQAY